MKKKRHLNLNADIFGFTLVEVMVVTGIIAVIAGIALPNLQRGKISSNDASAKATLKSIASALENYMVINTVYPTDPNDLLTAAPPYLNRDYFLGNFFGYTFSHNLTAYTYTITATPITIGQTGTTTYTMTTGVVLTPSN